MNSSTTFPILEGMVQSGELQSFELKTIEDYPGENSREHDQLTLVFPSGHKLVIDTFCSGALENCSIVIDNAEAP
jgi:hypothetical protein